MDVIVGGIGSLFRPVTELILDNDNEEGDYAKWLQQAEDGLKKFFMALFWPLDVVVQAVSYAVQEISMAAEATFYDYMSMKMFWTVLVTYLLQIFAPVPWMTSFLIKLAGSFELRIGEHAVNDWLDAYIIPSSTKGRDVPIPSEFKTSWSTYGGTLGINTLKKAGLAVTEKSNGAVVDGNGRHWIAVGPRVLNPDYPDDGKLWWDYDGLTIGTKVDILIKHRTTGKLSYVYAIVGDLRGHTYNPGQPGHGIRNSGIPYPNSWNAKQGVIDSDNSSVEFYRTGPGYASQSTFNASHEIVRMIVH